MISILIMVIISNFTNGCSTTVNLNKARAEKVYQLTAGPPKKKAVQTYVKLYWDDKIKQEVIRVGTNPGD